MGSRQPERSIPDVRDVFQRFHPQPQQRILEEEGGGGKDRLKRNNNLYGESLSAANNRSPAKGTTTTAPVPLTEKDLKHIERHLSMKKTIRKQLSRHLSKAFVDDKPAANATNPADANFLEMMLRGEEEAPKEEGVATTPLTPPTRQLSASSRNGSSNLESAEPAKKSNFWKKLTIRSRSKR